MPYDFSTIQDPLVQQYLKDKYGDGNKVKNAEQGVDNANAMSAVAGFGDMIANAGNRPQVLENRMQDLGKAPAMTTPDKIKTDVSGLQKQAQLKLDRATSAEDNAVKMAFEQRKAELAQKVMAEKNARDAEQFKMNYDQKEREIKHKGGGQFNLSDPLHSIPPQLRDNYLSSQTKVKEFDNAVMDVDKLIDQAASFSLESHLTPKALGGGDYNSLKAKIAAAIMNRVPGIRSDADFRNIVEPMIPHPSDPPELAAKRAHELKAMLKSNRPVNEVGNVYMPKQSGASGSWDDGLDTLSDDDLTKLYNEKVRK